MLIALISNKLNINVGILAKFGYHQYESSILAYRQVFACAIRFIICFFGIQVWDSSLLNLAMLLLVIKYNCNVCSIFHHFDEVNLNPSKLCYKWIRFTLGYNSLQWKYEICHEQYLSEPFLGVSDFLSQ